MTPVLLDTNAYLRLAKRIRPLLGIEFGQKKYALTILKDVEDEVKRSKRLSNMYPWFNEVELIEERDSSQVRLSDSEKESIRIAQSIFRGHILGDIDQYTRGGRSPPSDTDCRVLAFGQIRDSIVVTDDLGMHLLASEFDLTIWHGWQLISKMKAAKLIDNNKIREIYAALENNDDCTKSWADAKHDEFKRIFGAA